jgi:hypothetical protein
MVARGNGMKPKYSKGSKVRIKSHDILGRVMDPKIHLYENMAGEIIESISIVGFIREPWSNLQDPDERITIYHYTVRIDDHVTLHDVLEDCLEMID